LNKGLNVELRISDVFINGKANNTINALPIAITPPALCGIDLKIA
jgi:hypothetical protein